MNWKFAQDTAFDICHACSIMQRIAGRWRDPKDVAAQNPLAVSTACRQLARLLIAIAEKIEATVEKKGEAA